MTWTLGTDAQEHLDEHNQFDHSDLASLTEGKVLGVESGIIKQVDGGGGAFLPLAGGTMGGDIDVDGNNITSGSNFFVGKTATSSRIVFDTNEIGFYSPDGTRRVWLALNNNMGWADSGGGNVFTWVDASARFDMAADLRFIGTREIVDLSRLNGRASAHLYLRAGSATLATIIEDFTGQARFTVGGSDVGDIFFQAGGGSVVLKWDEGTNSWEFGADLTSVDQDFIIRATNSGAAGQEVKIYADDAAGATKIIFGGGGAQDTFLYHAGLARFNVGATANRSYVDLNMDTNKITGLVDPTSDQEAATKKYVDDNVGGGSGGLDVTELSADTTLTESGVYVVNSDGAIRTITLPILSGTPSAGYRIQIIREGSNLVYLEPNAADDYWDATTQRTLFDDFAAVSVAVGSTGGSWLELGRWRTVT